MPLVITHVICVTCVTCPLAATPVEGQNIPKVLLGFNNWKIKKEPLSMKHSSIQVGDRGVMSDVCVTVGVTQM